MKSSPKAVYDSNIYISGIFWRGTTRHLLELARGGKVEVSVSLPILTEIHRTITGRKFLTQEEADQTIRDILSYTKRTSPKRRIHAITTDPDDNKVLECAVTSNSQFVVSNDHHLTDLKKYRKIKIVRAGEFWKKFAEEKLQKQTH